jgi:hypothetical protein
MAPTSAVLFASIRGLKHLTSPVEASAIHPFLAVIGRQALPSFGLRHYGLIALGICQRRSPLELALAVIRLPPAPPCAPERDAERALPRSLILAISPGQMALEEAGSDPQRNGVFVMRTARYGVSSSRGKCQWRW